MQPISFTARCGAFLLDVFLISVLTVGTIWICGLAAATDGGVFAAGLSHVLGARPEHSLVFGVLGSLIGTLAGLLLGWTLYCIYALAFILVETLTSMTPAKYLLGLRVRRRDGTPASRAQLLLRGVLQDGGSILWLLSFTGFPFVALMWPWMFITLVGCFLCLTPRRQALHDRLSGTAVFKNRS